MRFITHFFAGRDLYISTNTSQSHANDRINSALDNPIRGLFLSALSGYAAGDSIKLKYTSVLWPFPVITFQGAWRQSSESISLQGKLKTSLFLKSSFALVFLLPFLLFYNLYADSTDIGIHSLAASFGFLTIAVFMDLLILTMGAVFLQNAETKIKKLLT